MPNFKTIDAHYKSPYKNVNQRVDPHASISPSAHRHISFENYNIMPTTQNVNIRQKSVPSIPPKVPLKSSLKMPKPDSNHYPPLYKKQNYGNTYI
jgi:hypothetical protein